MITDLGIQSPDGGTPILATPQNLLEIYPRVMPAKLINAVACILEDIAAKVRVFGVTRTTRVPYVSYINKQGLAISGFVSRDILSLFKGTHVGFKNHCLIVTDLETGEQTVTKLEYGDTVEVVGDRYDKAYIWAEGRVLSTYHDGWVNVLLGNKPLRFRGEELELVRKAPALPAVNQSAARAFREMAAWSPYKGVRKHAHLIHEQQQQHLSKWDSMSDEELFNTAVEAKRDKRF